MAPWVLALCLLVVASLPATESARTRARHKALAQSAGSTKQQVLDARIGMTDEASAAPSAGSLADVQINKRVLVNGTLNANTLVTKNLTVVGDSSAHVVTASRVRATMISADIVEAGILRSPTGTITIDGNLALDGGLHTPPAAMFLQTSEHVVVNGVKQWRLWEHDSFERDAAGWSMQTRGSCGAGRAGATPDLFLGGWQPCAAAASAGANATKTFQGLPPHTQLRLKSSMHFFDRWDGEMAFAVVDGLHVWADTGRLTAQQVRSGLNLCGADSPETRLAAPMDVVLQHSDPNVTVSFGSTLQRNACEHSWAVDDVAVYVR